MAEQTIQKEPQIIYKTYTQSTSSESYWGTWHYRNIYIGDEINNIIGINIISTYNGGTNAPTIVQKLYGGNYLRIWSENSEPVTIRVAFYS